MGDTWSYRVQIRAADPSGLTTNALLRLNYTVSGSETVTFRGRTYSAYNSTISGSMTASGVIPPATYSVSSNNVSGWALSDRSNLARIAEHQMVYASGSVGVIIFFPLWMNTTTTSFHGPAEEDYDFPLELGDEWSYQGVTNTTGFLEFFTTAPGGGGGRQDLANDSVVDVRSWFNTTGPANVPAGAFSDSARIHSASNDGTVDRWYHPDVRNFVRMESHSVNGPNDYVHTWTNLTGYAPASPVPWPGTIRLSPQKISPGGWLAGNGTANPGEDLLVSIPATGATYRVTADPSGSWSLLLQAPLVNDQTPANADAGSHGILVEPATSPPGWNVSTLQLILPDLRADPADLVLSDSTPAVGVPVDVNATLRVATVIDVSSSFDVTFSIDGSEVSRTTLANVSAGTATTLGVSWTPTAGTHVIAFTADANGEVPETDEGNNTANRTVFVRGPDLVLWNITLESETTDTYVDPGTVGFVSTPAQGRLGGVLNVTFDVANFGGTDAPPGFLTRLVETQGLWGPPIAPPTYEAPVIIGVPAGATIGPATAAWQVPSAPGIYHLNLTVDASDVIVEESEANNTFAIVVNVSGPDYWVQTVTVPPDVTAGSVQSIGVRVRNDGQLGGDRDVLVSLYEGAGPVPVATSTISPLGSGASRDVTLSWTAPSVATVVSLRVVVDPDGRLEEMDESNNEGGATVAVHLAPLTTLAVLGRNHTTNTSLFVTSAAAFVLTAEDRSDAGLTTYVQIDAGAPTTYTGPFSLTTEGSHVLEYWSEDNLGGEEPHHTFAVSVDDSPPVATANAANAVGDRRQVTVLAPDAGVGLDRIEYRVDGGLWAVYAGPFDITGYGDHNVTYRAVDLLGNWGPEQTLNVTVSVEPVSPSGNWKPWLAVGFALALILLGLYVGRKDRAWSLSSPRTVGIVFGAAELATGALSTVSPALAVPPYGLGLVVDLAILLAGVFAILALSRKPSAPEEAAADPGTDK